MILPQVDHLLVQYDDEARFIRFRWLNPAALHVRDALRHGRELVRHYHPTHAFVDLRGMPNLSLEDELWMTAHWMPVVLSQRLQQVTVLLSLLAIHNQMAIEALLRLARPLIRFDIQFFTDETEGLEWLLHSSPRILELQTEWAQALSRATANHNRATMPLANALPAPSRPLP